MSRSDLNIPVKISSLDLHIAVSLDVRTDRWIVCLHGLQSNQKMYDDFREQSFLQAYSVLSLDFLGFGKSSHPVDFNYTLSEQFEAVIQTLQAFNIERFSLIAHSVGGMVGTLLLARLREKIEVFVNMEGNLSLEHCGASRLITEQYTYDQFVDFGFDEFLSTVPTSRRQWLQETSASAFYRTAKSIVDVATKDLMLIWTQSKTSKIYMCGADNSHKFKSIDHVTIPHAGHFVLMDNPQACYEVIEKILKHEE